MSQSTEGTQAIQSVRGMYDVVPPDSQHMRWVEDCAHRVMHLYGYGELRTPLLEYTPLFCRSIGEDTDIVEKEMYTFVDRDEHSLTLRPEGTASAVRAYVEHAVSAKEPISRWYYFGPMFRHERAQRGRYRQFYQLGAEVFGVAAPGIDAELIALLVRYINVVGLKSYQLCVNSLGCTVCRPAHRQKLIDYLAPLRDALCVDCQRRLQRNPLRVLDCKQPPCQKIAADAPTMLQLLCNDCGQHWEGFVGDLTRFGIAYEIDSRLVRGLDYYNRTTFELKSTAGNLGAQNTLAGGGRYDDLVAHMGGPAVPAVGFGLGIERLLLALSESASVARYPMDVGLVLLGKTAYQVGTVLSEQLRSAGMAVDIDYRQGSAKSQLKRVDKIGAKLMVMLGDREVETQMAVVRDMGTSTQQEVSLSQLPSQLFDLLKNTSVA